jgi:hypothetical protein
VTDTRPASVQQLQALVERIAPQDPARWERREPAAGRQVSAARARQLHMTLRQVERAITAGELPRGAKSQVAAVFSPRGLDQFLEKAVDGRFRDDPRGGELSWSSLATLRDCLKILGTAAGYELVLPRVYRERLDLKPPVPAAQRVALYRKLADLAAGGPLDGAGVAMAYEERARLLAQVAVVLDSAARSGEMELMRLDDLSEGEAEVRVQRRPQNAAHLPPEVEVWPLREGSQVAVRRWLKARAPVVERLEGARSALWVSLSVNPTRGLPLRAQGIRRSYARGVMVLNSLMAGEYGWEPLPGTLEQLRRSVELSRAGDGD